MRVKGQAVSVRGTLKTYDPVSGEFTVLFDIALTGPPEAGSPVSLIGFEPLTPTTVKDTVWGLTWEFIGGQ